MSSKKKIEIARKSARTILETKVMISVLLLATLSMATLTYLPVQASTLQSNFLEITKSEEAQYSLDYGATWTESTADLTGGSQPEGNFIDLAPTCTGFAFGVTAQGEIWLVTDTFAPVSPFDEWILIIDDEDSNPYPAETVVAGDTDGSQTYWVLDIQGGTYRIISDEDATAEIWGAAIGDAGDDTDFVHLEYVSGTGTSARLYALYKTGDFPIRYSTDGGATWSNLGSNTGATEPIALSVHNQNFIYIVEKEGNIRYSTDAGANWATLTKPELGPYEESSEYKDIEVYDGYVYILNSYGRVWYHQIDDTTGAFVGNWGYTDDPHYLQSGEPVFAVHVGTCPTTTTTVTDCTETDCTETVTDCTETVTDCTETVTDCTATVTETITDCTDTVTETVTDCTETVTDCTETVTVTDCTTTITTTEDCYLGDGGVSNFGKIMCEGPNVIVGETEVPGIWRSAAETQPADWIDATAAALLWGLCFDGVLYWDHDTNEVDQLQGFTKLPGHEIMSGGPLVNAPVKYYEGQKLAPVYYKASGGYARFFDSTTDAQITGAQLLGSEIGSSKDMFVIMILQKPFTDLDPEYAIMAYGFAGRGTLASSVYFKTIIEPDLSIYTRDYYIVQWDDTNANGHPDIPGTDLYTTITPSP